MRAALAIARRPTAIGAKIAKRVQIVRQNFPFARIEARGLHQVIHIVDRAIQTAAIKMAPVQIGAEPGEIEAGLFGALLIMPARIVMMANARQITFDVVDQTGVMRIRSIYAWAVLPLIPMVGPILCLSSNRQSQSSNADCCEPDQSLHNNFTPIELDAPMGVRDTPASSMEGF